MTEAKVPTAWSYSAWDLWRQCPLKYKLTKIDKLDKETSSAMIRGNRVHVALAKHLTGTAAMPPEVTLPYHRELVGMIRDFDGMKVVEQQWGFDKTWGTTGYLGSDIWFRAVLDVGLFYDDGEVHCIDWKTGKRYDSNDEQLELFSLAVMQKFPQAKHVSTRLVYLDAGTEQIDDHPVKGKEKLAAKWEEAARPMLADRTWPARPNDKCGFCPFGRGKGGQCRHG